MATADVELVPTGFLARPERLLCLLIQVILCKQTQKQENCRQQRVLLGWSFMS